MTAVKSCSSWLNSRFGCITVAILTLVEGIVFLGAPSMENEWYRVAVVWCTFSMFAAALLLCGVVQNCTVHLKVYFCLRGSQLLIAFVTFVGLLMFTLTLLIHSYTVGDYKPYKEICLIVFVLDIIIGLYTAVHMYLFFLVYCYYKSLVTDRPDSSKRDKTQNTKASNPVAADLLDSLTREKAENKIYFISLAADLPDSVTIEKTDNTNASNP